MNKTRGPLSPRTGQKGFEGQDRGRLGGRDSEDGTINAVIPHQPLDPGRIRHWQIGFGDDTEEPLVTIDPEQPRGHATGEIVGPLDINQGSHVGGGIDQGMVKPRVTEELPRRIETDIGLVFDGLGLLCRPRALEEQVEQGGFTCPMGPTRMKAWERSTVKWGFRCA